MSVDVHRRRAAATVLLIALTAPALLAQAPAAGDLKSRIASLSALDFPTRMNAARLIRREPAAEAVAALRDAIATHPDEFVRYRAFVLLTAFDDRSATDVARGVLRDRNDPSTLVTFADPDDLAGLMASGVLSGGMRPKVEACIRAATGGVERTHIIDGRAPDALLLEVFTGAGCGTMIVGRKEKATYLGVDLAG